MAHKEHGIIRWLIGRLFDARDRRQTPIDPKGDWVNKGSRYNEDWVWKEKKEKPVYVNVHCLGDEYIIVLSKRPRRTAIDTMKCEDILEAQIAVKALSSFYSPYGKVVTNTEIRETDSESLV